MRTVQNYSANLRVQAKKITEKIYHYNRESILSLMITEVSAQGEIA